MTDLTKKAELDIISAICNRALKASPGIGKKLDLFMDIDYAHQDSPMDLQKLLDFDDGNFMHDVTGIVANFNRQTKTMDNCFLPRSSVPRTSLPFFQMVTEDDGDFPTVAPLTELATFCRERIEAAEADGLEISDGDVVDLIADNSDAPLETIRAALVVAGYAPRFPNATRGRDGTYNSHDGLIG